MRVFFLLLAIYLPGLAEIRDIRVSATHVEAVIQYWTDYKGTCSWKISEYNTFDGGYLPITDLNTELFPGSNLDSRAGVERSGKNRVLKVGQYGRVEKSTFDNRWYARTLKNTTVHYYQVTCGASVESGSFVTKNIPTGMTHAPDFPESVGDVTGRPGWPTSLEDRTKEIVDPMTGTVLKNMGTAEAATEGVDNSAAGACTGSWTTPGNCTGLDGAYATYSGAAREVLYVPLPWASVNGAHIFNTLTIEPAARVTGGPTGDDRFLDICVTMDKTTCATPWKALDATACTIGGYTCSVGSTRPMDFWDAEPFHLWGTDADRGILIKPRTTNPAYTFDIDHIRYDIRAAGYGINMAASSGVLTCSLVPITDDGDGHTYHLCVSVNSVRLWSVDVTANRAYYLGPIRNIQSSPGAIFSDTNGRVFYHIDSGTYNQLYKYTISSAPGTLRTEHTAGFLVEPTIWTKVELTEAGYRLDDLGTLFNPAYNDEWKTRAQWGISSVQNGKIVFVASSGQNKLGWVAVYDETVPGPPGATKPGNFVAFQNTGWTRSTRYCTIHSTAAGPFTDWFTIGHGRYDISSSAWGAGPWWVKVQKPGGGDLAPGDTQFEILPYGGVNEPTDPTPSGGTLDQTIAAEPGDLFFFDADANQYIHTSDEIMEIVSIMRPGGGANPIWTMRRGPNIMQSPFWPTGYASTPRTGTHTIPAGGFISSVCRALPLNIDPDNGSSYWNPAQDATGNTIVYPLNNGVGTFPPSPGIYTADSGYASPQMFVHWNFGSHGYVKAADGLKFSVGGPPYCHDPLNEWSCWTMQWGTGINAIEVNPVTYEATVIPPFARISPRGIVGDYQSHPNFMQHLAPAWDKRWATDMLPPHQWGTDYGGTTAASAEAGTTTVFKVTGTSINIKHHGTAAKCGNYFLRNISSPLKGDIITDSTPWSWCQVMSAGECRTGSSIGDVFVSCPGKTGSCANSTYTTKYPQATRDVCISDNWAFGHGAVQVPTRENSIWGERTRVVVYPLTIPHMQSEYAASKPTVDGKVMIHLVHGNDRPDYWMSIPPRWPEADTVNRGTFIPLEVSIPAPPAKFSQAIVRFGYNPSRECTSRKQECVAVSATVNETTPYYFDSEVYTPLACAGGCKITIPALSRRVVYYQWEYQNASKTLIRRGPLQVMAVD